MAESVETTLSEVGVAKVIIAMKKADASAGVAAGMAAHFAHSDPAQETALAATALALSSSSRRSRPRRRPPMRYYRHLGLMLGTVTREGYDALSRDQRVSDIKPAPEPSLIRPVAAAAATPPKNRPTWGLTRLNIPALWERGLTGEGVIVGHLDTGVDGGHPSLRGAIGAFAEFDMAGEAVPGATAWDSGSHGTHTAGTIAGRSVDGIAFGVAPRTLLASGLVIEGGQVINRVLAGLDWIVAQRARVLSMSLGLRGFVDAFEVIIAALRDNNVLPIIAVGNEGPDTSRSPGNYATVLSIGACDVHDQVAGFSSSQTFNRPMDPFVPDLVAPGVDIHSCVPGGGFESMDGSSMATPHIAGLAALLLQANPAATGVQVEAAILASCQRPASMSAARANRGVPDGVRALQGVLAGAAAPTLAAYVPFGRARPKTSARRKAAAPRKAAKKASKKVATRRSVRRKPA